MHELATRGPGRRDFCTFRARGRLYGLDVAHVGALSTPVEVMPVPQAPPIVRGLANVRSRIILVLDLRAALGAGPSEANGENRLVLLRPAVADDLGLLVEAGGDVAHIAPDRIEAVGRGTGAPNDTADGDSSALVAGVGMLDGELLLILDPRALVDAAAQAIG